MSDVPGTLPTHDDVKQSATYRGLLAVVIILGVLIVLGVGALIAGLIMRSGSKGSAASSTQAFTLDPGSTILSSDVSGSRLILHVKNETGEEVDIVDIADGRLVSRIVSTPPHVPTR